MTSEKEILGFIGRACDLFAIAGSGMLVYAIRIDVWPMLEGYQIALLVAILLVLVTFPALGVYRVSHARGLIDDLWLAVAAWYGVVIVLVLLAFMSKTGANYSRLWMAAWIIGGTVAIGAFRVIAYTVLHKMRGRAAQRVRVLILGAGQLGQQMVDRIRDAGWTGFDIVGFLDDDPTLWGKKLANADVKGGLDKVTEFVHQGLADEVWIALPLRAQSRVEAVLSALKDEMVTIRYIPDLFGYSLLNHSISNVAGIPMIDLNSSPIRGINRMVKAVEDRLIAAIVLVLASPLLVIIAIAVRLSSPGPILFRQWRHGWDGRPFQILKFRTMVVHSEPAGEVTQAMREDTRMTAIGRFLRRTSLDELPQFFNVLAGQMSVVGPRPHATAHNVQYKGQIDAYMLRHKVKPGITGWAQVNGLRGETGDVGKMKLRVQYDLYYINHWSLWFDLKVILLTLLRGFSGPNAY